MHEMLELNILLLFCYKAVIQHFLSFQPLKHFPYEIQYKNQFLETLKLVF